MKALKLEKFELQFVIVMKDNHIVTESIPTS